MAAACSAEPSNTEILSNQNAPAEIYELVLAYYEGDSVTVGNDKAFELFQKAADQGLRSFKSIYGYLNPAIFEKKLKIQLNQSTP